MAFKHLCLLFTFVAICSFHTVIAADTFKNKLWGISMQVPDNWFTTNKTEADKNMDENIKLDSTQLLSVLKAKANSILLLSMMKYKPEDYPGVIPTIKITVLKNPTASFGGFTEFSKYLLDKWLALMKGGDYTTQPGNYTVDGVRAVFSEFEFPLETATTGVQQVHAKVCFIPMKGYLVQVSFMNAADDAASPVLFDQLLKTIHIDKAKYQP